MDADSLADKAKPHNDQVQLSGRIAVIDVETTGLDPQSDAVVSVGVVVIDDGVIDRSATVEILVNPGRPIPAQSTAFHGLTDSDVDTAGSLAAALQAIRPTLENAIVVGHHLPFDLAFLGLRPSRTVDTLAVSRLLWPGRGQRHNLGTVAERLGITIVDRHTASGDALLTAQVLIETAPLLHQRGLRDPASIAGAYRLQRNRRAQIRRSTRRRRMRNRRPYSPLRRRRNSKSSVR